MAQEYTHIYRSSQGVLGGVCEGIAKRFDVDTALVRLLAILLGILSMGSFVFVYLAIWLILPLEPGAKSALEVNPESFKSDIYEQVVNGANSAVSSSVGVTNLTSVPPVPPREASSYYATQARMQPSVAQAAQVPHSSTDAKQAGPSHSIFVGLAFGVVLIVFGAAALFSSITGQFAFVQFWPLVFVAIGAVRMVVPGKDSSRTLTTWLGALIVLVGLVTLGYSLGLYSIDLDTWLVRAGPFLIIALGLFIMGRASHSNILIVCAAIALVLFIAMGSFFSLHENKMEIGVSLPFSPETLFERSET